MGNGAVRRTKALGPGLAGPSRSGGPAKPAASQVGGAARDPEVRERPVPRRFTADYKLRMVREAHACTEPGQVGALLRRQGLYSSYLGKWRRRLQQGGVAARGAGVVLLCDSFLRATSVLRGIGFRAG